jgi:hypothetical protein
MNRTFLAVQLTFEDGDLMPQREDFGVFVLVAYRQQPQQRERVGHTEPGQPKQRNGSSSRSAQRRSPSPRGRGRDCIGNRVSMIKVAMTRTDEIFGTRRFSAVDSVTGREPAIPANSS